MISSFVVALFFHSQQSFFSCWLKYDFDTIGQSVERQQHQYPIVNPIDSNQKYDLATRFESVEKTLSEERAKIDGQRAGEKEDANKQSTQTLTIR